MAHLSLLEYRTLTLLQHSLVVEKIDPIYFDEITDEQDVLSKEAFVYSTPCVSKNCRFVQESTPTLLTALAFAKAGLVNESWNVLDAFFAVQGKNGFLPKYRYAANSTDEMFLVNTTIPNYPLFGSVPVSYTKTNTSLSQKMGLKGSGRISAIPFHASIILDVFSLSNQSDTDLENLSIFFDKLVKWHGFLHKIVMRGCDFNRPLLSDNSGSPQYDPTKTYVQHQGQKSFSTPCYNIIHPFESMISFVSPVWNSTLPSLNDTFSSSWSQQSAPPDSVRGSPEYPGDFVYNASISILDCISQGASDYWSDDYDDFALSIDYERKIVSKCGFAMLDLGFAAALSKSDRDLIEIGQILKEQNHRKQPSKVMSGDFTNWLQQSHNVLESLWNQKNEIFLPKIISQFNDCNNEQKNSLIPDNNCSSSNILYISKFIEVPVSDIFMVLYADTNSRKYQMDSVIYRLLRRDGNFSFDCGQHPIYSVGGCPSIDEAQGSISPLYNYWILKGLEQHEATVFASYIQNSTVALVCGMPTSWEILKKLSSCGKNEPFANYYNTSNYLPQMQHNNDSCQFTSSSTAAITYNLVVPDKDFSFVPAPPISAFWVDFLIAIEFVIALAIGLSCIVLSLNLMRRLESYNEADAFVRMMRSELTDVYALYGREALLQKGSLGSDGASDGTSCERST